MNAKKAALRGMAILIVALALCMFFSGTIRTICTAKVKIVTPRQGKFSQNVELTGKLTFTKRADVPVGTAKDPALEITSVKVNAGQAVEKGDVLFTASVSGYEGNMTQYRADYDALEEQSLALERKDIRLRRAEQAWADAYYRLTDARAAATDSRLSLEAALRVAGVSLKDGALPDDAPEEIRAAYDAAQTANQELDAAKKQMNDASRYAVSDDVRSYVTEKKKLAGQLAEAEEKMLALKVYAAETQSVVAPEKGYIVEMYVKNGDTLQGGANAYAFCPADNPPVLRASLEGVTLQIAKGMSVTFTGKKDREMESEVSAVNPGANGEKTIDVELDEDMLDGLGGAYAASQNDVALKIEYKAKKATTLLPASAVRGADKDRYVFTVDQATGAFGSVKQVVRKTAVTLIMESNGVASLEEDLSYQQIAYMEDRPIEENTAIMAYDA